LSFETNKGQTDPDVDFLARGQGYTLFLRPTEAALSLTRARPAAPGRAQPKPETAVVRMQVLGADPAARATADDILPGKVNSFTGVDRRQWITGLSTFGKVAYRGVYPGIDLVYHGRQGQLEYDFVVAPGANPASIGLGFAGADRVTLDKGDLVVASASGEVLRQAAPRLYQDVGGRRRAVTGRFVLRGDREVGFDVGPYDARRALVIDPTLVYSTFLGGTANDFGFGIVTDPSGNVYLGGQTSSAVFPRGGAGDPPPVGATPGAYQPAKSGSSDGYVLGLDANGTTLLFSTYIGGSLDDGGWDLGRDAAGNLYLGGSTNSSDNPGTLNVQEAAFPTTPNAFDRDCNADGDGVCAPVPPGWFQPIPDDPNTPEDDSVPAACPLNVNPNGCATPPGLADNFLAKFNPNGSQLLYSTLLGGSDSEVSGEEVPYAGPLGIAVDGDVAYLTSWTGSADFPVRNGFQTSCASCSAGNPDAYLAAIDTGRSGNASLAYSTFLGGSGIEDGKGVALGVAGTVYVTGTTLEDPSVGPNDFPTTGTALQPRYRGGLSDAYLATINTSRVGASSLVASTFLGGGGTDEGWAVASGGGMVYVTGYTTSGPNPNPQVAGDPAPVPKPYFPVTPNAYDTTFNGRATTASGSTLFLDGDAFVARLPSSLSALSYSTFVGGPDADYGNGIAVDYANNAYVTGWTTCRNVSNDTLAQFEGNGTPTGRNPGPASVTGVPNCDAPNQAGAFPQVNPLPGGAIMNTTNLGPELHNSPTAVFVTKLNAAGSRAVYSVLLDGPGFDRGFAIAVRDRNAAGRPLPAPEAYVTGRTGRQGYPVVNAYDATYNGGGRDAYISKISG
jgi:hypothetical protein